MLFKNKDLLAYQPEPLPLGNPLIVLPTTDSTNNYAMGQAKAGLAVAGTAYMALEQTRGKGQRGKAWLAAPGENLLISLVLDPQQLGITKPFRLSVAMALGCHDFFSAYATREQTRIKWPNDLYWQDRKAGGLLIENSYVALTEGAVPDNSAANWKWAVAGMGININQTRFPDHLPNPVSLKQITGKTFELMEMARELLNHLERRLIRQPFSTLLNDYNERLYKKNEWVTLRKGESVFRTCITRVDEEGRLITQDNEQRLFHFGDIEWMPDSIS